jgi:hypothetical protein
LKEDISITFGLDFLESVELLSKVLDQNASKMNVQGASSVMMRPMKENTIFG